MPRACAVVGCFNKEGRDAKQFFRIPAEVKRGSTEKQKLSVVRRCSWIMSLKRTDFTETKLKYSWICGDHFISGKPAKLLDRDNPDWIPSVKMGDGTPKKCFITELEYHDYLQKHSKRSLQTADLNCKNDENIPPLSFRNNQTMPIQKKAIIDVLVKDNARDFEIVKKPELKKSFNKETLIVNKAPSSADYKEKLKAIKKIAPNAPIFTLFCDSDISLSDQEETKEEDIHPDYLQVLLTNL